MFIATHHFRQPISEPVARCQKTPGQAANQQHNHAGHADGEAHVRGRDAETADCLVASSKKGPVSRVRVALRQNEKAAKKPAYAHDVLAIGKNVAKVSMTRLPISRYLIDSLLMRGVGR